MEYLLLFWGAFALTYLVNTSLKKVCLRFNIFNRKEKIPFIGGMALSLGFILSYIYFNFRNHISLPVQLIYLLTFSFIILVVEIIDDLIDFSLKMRVSLQLIIIVVFLLFGKMIQIYFLPDWFNYLLSFLWIMGIVNAFNLIDIADGLCGGVALIAGLAFLTVTLFQGETILNGLFLCLGGAISAFLLLNFPPAKIFMGNSGSHFLGFLFAGLGMYGDYASLTNPLALVLPLFILAFPIIDTLFLVIARLKKGIIPLRKSGDHLYLRLLSAGNSPRQALLSIYLVSLLWGLNAAAVVFGPNPLFYISVALAVLSTLSLIAKAVGHER